ncbi:hypothetical protein N9V76_01695, partial [Candidatus Poseidoniales archaeon]|nr:hypothetical protein [Candidatus Poseidoniales archaeon]
MKRITKTLLLSFLMLVLGLSAATSSLNESSETTALEEISPSQEVILSLNLLDEPGHQEGSIYTDTTFSAGDYHTCAILDDGSLNCWGDDDYGQLGDGGTNSDKNTPVSVSLGTGRTAVAVSAGYAHTCAILDDGSLKCWGDDNWGQLGDGGSNTAKTTPVSVSLGNGRTAVAVSAGFQHTCAILDDGSLKCWGLDGSGQLGDGGSNTNKDTPVSVSLGNSRTAVAVSAGDYHNCAILD